MRRSHLIIAILLGAVVVSTSTAVARPAAPDTSGALPAIPPLPGERANWTGRLTTGFDSFVHSYPLATEDTTETVAEYLVAAGLEGRSARNGRHRWNLEAESSLGTQLFRERLEAGYRALDGSRTTRVRLAGSLRGRQYRRDTEYSLSSDNLEGRLDARAVPLVARSMRLECRGWGQFQNYKTPSSLEVDQRELGFGAAIRSRGLGDHLWSVGGFRSSRVHPDTSRIDRKTTGLELDYERVPLDGFTLRLHHRSDRRRVEDETARPSAWIHWSDAVLAVPAAGGQVFSELQSELWDYDQENSVYLDTWRAETWSGFGWGDILGRRWRIGPTCERLAAGDSPETYTQFGLRAGVEAYSPELSGSLTAEFGARRYDSPADGSEVDTMLDPALVETLSDDGSSDLFAYSNFHYFEIWLMATWRLAEHFSLDCLASYEPERHSQPEDDSALGYASVRLNWRP